ncbi:MAG: gliding motility-associated C-terminal domain-containing protein, partial [Bacteroidales bacterium]|nr:gliding motility-associated C-terminal domain-containing protein [Bacteroidales bacterium]
VAVTAAGGTGPYSYTLNPGGVTNATGFFPGLVPGTYSVSLTDSELCGPVISNNFTIVEPGIISITSTNFTDILCNNDNDGTITVTATGGNAPLTYTLNPGAIQVKPTGDFTGIAAGTYFVNVSDPMGCPEAVSGAIIIDNPDPVSITSEAETDISCNGSNDGSVSVTAVGGTGSLHYTLNPVASTQIDNGVFTGLSPNVYSVSVTDDNACPADVSSNFNITEPAIITLPLISSTDITCFGNNNGSISVTAAGGTGPYSYEITPGGTSNTTGVFTSLGPNTYSITVTDSELCSEVFTDIITINEPPVLGISLAKTDIPCNGLSNGTITVTATGGTLPYSYSKNGIVYQASNVFSGLSKNNYTIWVKDAKGCLKSDIITIDEPEELKINSEINSSVNNICYGDSFGEIRILSVSGGVEPYYYSIDNGLNYVTTPDFQFLPSDSYQVKVKDANDCETTGSLLLISQPPALKITSISHLDVIGCFGDANGQIAIEGIGGTGTRYFEIDNGSRNTSGIFTSLSGGLHTLSLIDDNNCQVDSFETILEPLEITFTNVDLSHVTGCPGDNNGIIDASASGGVGGFQYELDLSGLQPTGYFDLLLAGTYDVSAEDASGCRIDSSVIITEPAPISIDSESASDASCSGVSDGEVSITVSGGTGPYVYTLNPVALSNASGIFGSLPVGDYTISVDDLTGCGPITSNTLSVSEPPAIILDSLSTSEILCSGDSNAEIHIYLSGGTGPFQYSIDDGGSYSGTSDFTSLNAGTYHISAMDANLCTLRIDTVSFVSPSPLTIVTETVTGGAICFGDAVGILEYEITGGTGSIEYSVDNGVSWQSSGIYNGMPGGDYTILARDQNNCELNSSVLTIIQPTEITADISVIHALDELNLGSINISNATGGTGGLEFYISGLGGSFSGQTDYYDLIPGFYDVVIRDMNLCTFDTTVEVKQIPALSVTVSITHLRCNNTNDGQIQMLATDPQGFVQYSIDDSTSWSDAGLFGNLPGGDYIIFARDSVGRFFGDTITVIEPVALDIFSNITPATCSNLSGDGAIEITVIGATGTVSYNWSTGATSRNISGLDAGKYWLNVTDANLCTATDTIDIPGITNVTANAGADTSLCFGETIILNGQGGTVMSWIPETGLSNPNISNPVFDSDTSISYYLTVVGLNDCYDIDTINITVFPNLGLNAGNDTSIIEGQSAILTTTGGPYLTYLWEPATGVDDTASASPVISPLATTTYIVSGLTEDGCYDKDTITISLIENLIVYNAFSPNGDGINEFWDIENAQFFPDIIVEVYNRWGVKFFSSVGYTDDKRWDGTNKGKEAPIGTYYFVVIPYYGATPITGPVTIVR